MIIPDVAVLVHAWQPSSPQHAAYREWLETVVNGEQLLGLPHVVLRGIVRALTHPKVFERPADPSAVLTRVEDLQRRSNVVDVTPTPTTWSIFAELCRSTQARGNDVPDAYIAALAIGSGAQLVTADRGFARFEGLNWSHPLDA